jgi:hypothetical protein
MNRPAELTLEDLPPLPEVFATALFQKEVELAFAVAPTGEVTPTMITSCGDAELDKWLLSCLAKWKARPALQDGEAVAAMLAKKFTLVVEEERTVLVEVITPPVEPPVTGS